MASGAADPALRRLRPDDLVEWAERVIPALRKMAAGSGGRFHAEDIATAILRGQMQLWAVTVGDDVACVLVTDIHDYPRARALRLLGLVGSGWRRWMHLAAQVEEWGRSQGCVMCEALLAGAKWKLMMPGYEMDHLRVMKPL